MLDYDKMTLGELSAEIAAREADLERIDLMREAALKARDIDELEEINALKQPIVRCLAAAKAIRFKKESHLPEP